MPVEIREMVVKAKLPARTRGEGEADEGQDEDATPANQALLVEACVAAVMKILEKKSWR